MWKTALVIRASTALASVLFCGVLHATDAKLNVIRKTELALLPERGMMLGNFGATAITSEESWRIDADIVNGKPHPRGADGTVWLSRVQLSTPNRLSLGRPLSELVGDSATWKQTAVLQAKEANQAAAADEHYIFAIDNTQVAKYDRKSGERVAVSTGPAKHLNSGFLWNGRLFCAHSNYPLTPELSEIKVVDVTTMKLSTFKEFGNFGGSLTWAVRHDESWWCNFARYGDDNATTFLVKFDDDWREQGRWTYPPEVIRQLGRYSLSGGIWRKGFLLVTGHDDPVVFRLRLPKTGKELEYVDKQMVPFTGQGFAPDPKTGGMVGINRPKRLVIFAMPDTEDQPGTKR